VVVGGGFYKDVAPDGAGRWWRQIVRERKGESLETGGRAAAKPGFTFSSLCALRAGPDFVNAGLNDAKEKIVVSGEDNGLVFRDDWPPEPSANPMLRGTRGRNES
jgi:hypothetical protein